MLLTKSQLAWGLCQLTEIDSDLLTDIVAHYVQTVDDNKLNDLEEYVNANMNELRWVIIIITEYELRLHYDANSAIIKI